MSHVKVNSKRHHKIIGDKQIPKFKYQITNKSQYSIPNDQNTHHG
ncbi:hypothetical protein D1AOALGA4SA_3511 [Olavius algarvensis Delta 1 endosymbiont]|nr:hypothetical protein D1AOALGA4SA_3511 [Olavius algarvensis Delta 1 endosymbiont]